MLKLKNKELFKFSILLPMVFIILLASIVIYNQTVTFHNHLNKHLSEAENEFYNQYKQKINSNVKNIQNIIKFQSTQAQIVLKEDLEDKLNSALSVAQEIYNTNKNTLSKNQIRKLLIDYFAKIRFYNGRGYFYILDYSSNKILGHPMKKYLGTDFSTQVDIDGNYIMESQKNTLQSQKIAFSTIYFNKPNDQVHEYKKLIASTIFKPLNLVIGTGEYLDEVEKKIQKKVLDQVKIFNKDYGDEYVLILKLHDINGGKEYATMLLGNQKGSEVGKKLSSYDKDSKGFAFVEKILQDIRKEGESYTKYWYPDKHTKEPKAKLSYFYLQKDWNWIIGCGFYLNKYDKNLEEIKEEKEEEIFKLLLDNTVITTIIVFIILLIFYFVMRKLNNYTIKYIDAMDKATKAKSEFLANMSHEIRTPLNAIIGFINILQANETDKKKLQYLETIESSSHSLINIINDILDFSKIENNMLSVEYIDFDPQHEFKSIKKLFKASMDQKNLRLYSSYNDMPDSLIGDPYRIKQVISNLLSNAIKFTDEGKGIYLEINYDQDMLYVSVKDEGVGIKREYLQNIFTPFTQEDTSTTRRYGGSGLGLTISYQLVKLMGGELQVKSEFGKGSEFYFSLPLKIGTTIKDTKNTKQQEVFNNHILLVEDNKTNQIFMKVFLEKLGTTFDIANDGVEAITKFKQNSYDLILMDENMPNMNGIEATKHILEYENEKNLPHTPIVALTANALKGDKERFLDAGMDEYLTKPLNKEAFIEVMNKLEI